MTQEHDYVIVGAGSAGCALAGRLSEDPSISVLLIESGGADDRIDIHIPLAMRLLLRSECDWAYETEPQAHLNQRRIYVPAGRCLGGGSSINAMLYSRGTPAAFDDWQVPGWAYQELLPFFKAAENQERGASAHHAVGGPLDVTDLRSINPLSAAFLEACEQVGLPASDDLSIIEGPGFGCHQTTIRGAQRCSSAVAYLHPAMERPNLTVLTGAHATRVLLDGGRAVGVQLVRDGVEHNVTASREVVLAAGALRSPHLLMLSGIGPQADLQALGLEHVADLPGVGLNLQDHPIVAVAYHCTEPISLEGSDDLGVVAAYVETGSGPLTSNGNEAGGFVHALRDGAPDLQFHFNAAWFVGDGQANPEGHGFTFGPIVARPFSRGRLSLRSADPLDRPAIDPAYLADERDLAVLVEGIRTARRIAAAQAFDRYRGGEYCPGPDVQSDEEINAWVRANAGSAYHPSGTCRMGADDLAVVDANLRVHGVDGLRVCDASVMPVLVNANPNATVIAIAERCAALIRSQQPTERSLP